MKTLPTAESVASDLYAGLYAEIPRHLHDCTHVQAYVSDIDDITAAIEARDEYWKAKLSGPRHF